MAIAQLQSVSNACVDIKKQFIALTMPIRLGWGLFESYNKPKVHVKGEILNRLIFLMHWQGPLTCCDILQFAHHWFT